MREGRAYALVVRFIREVPRILDIRGVEFDIRGEGSSVMVGIKNDGDGEVLKEFAGFVCRRFGKITYEMH